MSYTPDSFKRGDLLTSSHLNKISEGIKTNSEEIDAAKEQLAAAQEQLSAISADNTDLKASVENSISQLEQLVSDLESNAQSDLQTAEAVKANLDKINENKASINELISGLASNSELDSTVKALAESNKSVNDAQAEALAGHETRIGALEQDYVSKKDTKDAFKAQSLYNLVTYKFTAANGDTSMIHNESDGGGIFYDSTASDFKSFVGANSSKTLGVQIYVKNKADNVGCRLNCGQQGFFYTVGKTSGAYEAGDELATKKDINQAVADLNIPEDNSSELTALKAQLVALEKALDAKTFGLAADLSTEGTVDAAGKAITLSAATVTAPATITAKSVTSDSLEVNSAVVNVAATDVVNFTNLTVAGAYDKATQGNAQMLVKGTDVVRFVGSNFKATGYNQIEIWNNGDAAPSSIQIENCNFEGASNVPVQIHATAENAVVTIKDCVFGPTSNPIRFSNILNVSGVVVNIENCEFQGVDANAAYAFIVLAQDFSSADAAAVEEANRFSPDKLVINFKNCTLNGEKITPAEGNQYGLGNLVYVYRDKGDPKQLAYDAAKFPTVTVK